MHVIVMWTDLKENEVINWSEELVQELSSRLYPLWNRTAGDCLLDSLLQATWGVMDRDNSLRKAMSDSLNDAASRYKFVELEEGVNLYF